MQIKSILHIAVFPVLCIFGQLAAAANLPPVESFFSEPSIAMAQISPKGNYVAVVVKDQAGGQLIVVRDTANPEDGTIVAGAKEDKIQAVYWVNENRLAYSVHAAHTEVHGGGQDLIAVDRDGKNVSHLVSGNWEHEQESTASHIKNRVLTYDYEIDSTLHDGSDNIIVRKYFWKLTDPYHPESAHLYRLNTKTRDIAEFPVGKPPHAVSEWMSDGHDVPRIALSQIDGHCIVHYRASATNDWEVLNDEECYANKSFSPHFFDGDNSLIVAADYKGHVALFRYDLKAHKIAAEPFLSVEGFDFAGNVEYDAVVNKMVGIHFVSDAHSTVWFDPKYKDLQAKIDKLLPQTVNTISCGADCIGAPAVLVTSDSDRQPTQYMIYNFAKDKLVGLGSAYPDIKPEQMGLRDFYHYKARDGMSIPVYVTTPPGKATQPLPAIVLVHGGPWVRGGEWEWENEAQFLASRGYIVIQPEFRGSTGFGYKLFRTGWKQWGQSMQDDLADAALWAIKEHGADPKRIGIMGASYGGYATLMGLIKNPEIFRCGVDWAGVTDSNLMFTLAEGDFSDDTKKYDLTRLMGDRVVDGAMFKQYSPLENAAKLKQPLLMAHGAEDVRVPIAQATAFHDAVTKTNSHVEWIVYKTEGHGWHLEENNIDFWKHVDAFLDKNLRKAD
ncbi:MAG TPA: prolyl oligopeptidase family serine peptidase [Burkholderiaceae bacterium]|jgi:acetyl esterase/lipase